MCIGAARLLSSIALLAPFLAARPLNPQIPQTTAPDAADGTAAQACPFDVCALRVSGNSLLRGFAGEPVGRLGPWGGDVRILLDGPEAAARHAAHYRRTRRLATLAWIVSVPLVPLGLGAIENGPADFHDDEIIVFAAAWTGGLYLLNRALVLERSGRHAVHRAVWSYNAPYVPDAMPPPPLYPVAPRRDPSAWLILGGGALGAVAGRLKSRDAFYWGTLLGAGTGALLSAVMVRW